MTRAYEWHRAEELRDLAFAVRVGFSDGKIDELIPDPTPLTSASSRKWWDQGPAE